MPNPPKESVDSLSSQLQALRSRHADIKAIASELDVRLARLCNWISQLPGRVETGFTAPDPDGDEHGELFIRVHRLGKAWSISTAWVYDNDYDGMKFTPIAESGIKVKLEVLSAAPRIVERMVKSQAFLSQQITEVNKAFDDFARQAGMPEVGGA